MMRLFSPALCTLCLLPACAATVAHADGPAERRQVSVWSAPTPVTAVPDAGPTRQDLSLTIENGEVRLRFKPAAKGFGLGSLVYVKNGREALSKVDDRPRWWKIDVRTPARQVVSVSNLDASPGTFSAFDDPSTGGRFLWDKVSLPGVPGTLSVAVTVRLEPGSSLARMRIAVTNRLEQAALWDVHFPYINHLGYPGQSDVLVPSTYSMMVQGELHRAVPADGPAGRLYASYLGAPYVDYPGGGFPIGHMSATIGDNTVVYVGCHDPAGNTKGYGWQMGEVLRFHVPPAGMGTPGVGYEQDWDFVIGPISGDWFDAVRVYRAWAIRQSWCAKGPLADRQDQPREFFEVPYWGDPQWPVAGYREQEFPLNAKAATLDKQFHPAPGDFKPDALAYDVQRDEMLRRNTVAVTTYGLPLGIQWYGWHKCRFDGNYPQYFPPRPGFREALQTEAEPGLFVHGFLNGLWFDRTLPEFADAAPWQITDAATFNQQAAGPVDPLKAREGTALMCPATKFWQGHLRELAGQMTDIGFQGAYLDVLANAGGMLCFNPKHDHATGGGPWCVDGSRKLVEGMKGEQRLRYISSECFSEPLGQSVDLFYTWNDWKEGEAPLLGAVYGGYLQWYGSGNGGGIDEAARLARTVFWGGRICNYASADTAFNHDGLRYLIARFVGLQRKTHKYLTYGEMVRPPAWKGDEPRRVLSPATEQRPAVTIEAVERAAWKAADGSVGLCLISYAEQPIDMQFELSTMRGLIPSDQAKVIAPASTAAAAFRASSDGRVLRVTLAPAVPVLVEVGRMKDEG